MKYTGALLGINLLVFVWYVIPYIDAPYEMFGYIMGTEISGTPVDMQNMWPGLATYMFGHAGILHLLANMMMLVFAGVGLERRAGLRIIPIYLASGVAGAMLHMTASDMAGVDVPLLGASAAVSGVFGAACAYRTASLKAVAYFVVVLNILPIFGTAFNILPDHSTSYVSHLGGAVAGGVTAIVWRRLSTVRSKSTYNVDRGWVNGLERHHSDYNTGHSGHSGRREAKKLYRHHRRNRQPI